MGILALGQSRTRGLLNDGRLYTQNIRFELGQEELGGIFGMQMCHVRFGLSNVLCWPGRLT